MERAGRGVQLAAEHMALFPFGHSGLSRRRYSVRVTLLRELHPFVPGAPCGHERCALPELDSVAIKARGGFREVSTGLA